MCMVCVYGVSMVCGYGVYMVCMLCMVYGRYVYGICRVMCMICLVKESGICMDV